MQCKWSYQYDCWAVLTHYYDKAEDVVAECCRLSATYSGPEGSGFVVQLPGTKIFSIVSEADIKSACKGIRPTWLPKTIHLQT